AHHPDPHHFPTRRSSDLITGRTELLLLRLTADDPRRRDIELVKKTADRAASLTQQLLAFSRKQMLQPRVLDLNDVVGNMAQMLRSEEHTSELQSRFELVC